MSWRLAGVAGVERPGSAVCRGGFVAADRSGVALGLAAVVALSEKQRYAVWFPLVLGGVLLLGIIPFRLRKFLKHYKDLELRRMMAIDAMKG